VGNVGDPKITNRVVTSLWQDSNDPSLFYIVLSSSNSSDPMDYVSRLASPLVDISEMPKYNRLHNTTSLRCIPTPRYN